MSDVPPNFQDLIVLVADKDAKETFQQLLQNRYKALGIRQLSFTVLSHVGHDPGCRTGAATILRPFIRQYQYAIVVFDREGCGSLQSRVQIEGRVQQQLESNGRQGRCAVVVIDPELEVWVWSTLSHVARTLGWKGTPQTLRQFLYNRGLWHPGALKPSRPKEAMQTVLQSTGKPWSASIFGQLARQVGLRRCSDPAFRKLLATLQRWFPE